MPDHFPPNAAAKAAPTPGPAAQSTGSLTEAQWTQLREMSSRFAELALVANRTDTDAAWGTMQAAAGHVALALARMLGLLPATDDPDGPAAAPVGWLRPLPPPQQVRAVKCTATDILDVLQVGDQVFLQARYAGIETYDEATVTARSEPGHGVQVTTVFGVPHTVHHPGVLYRPPRDGERGATVPLTPAYGTQATITATAPGVGPELAEWLANVLRHHLSRIGVTSIAVHDGDGRLVSARRADVYSPDGTLWGENEVTDLISVTHRERPRPDWLETARQRASGNRP
jgi:hypothetical protein